MKKHNVYLNAAKLIANGKANYSCYAISTLGVTCYMHLAVNYEAIFSHKRYPEDSMNTWWSSPNHTEENRLCRSLALLFMHEMQGE